MTHIRAPRRPFCEYPRRWQFRSRVVHNLPSCLLGVRLFFGRRFDDQIHVTGTGREAWPSAACTNIMQKTSQLQVLARVLMSFSLFYMHLLNLVDCLLPHGQNIDPIFQRWPKSAGLRGPFTVAQGSAKSHLALQSETRAWSGSDVPCSSRIQPVADGGRGLKHGRIQRRKAGETCARQNQPWRWAAVYVPARVLAGAARRSSGASPGRSSSDEAHQICVAPRLSEAGCTVFSRRRGRAQAARRACRGRLAAGWKRSSPGAGSGSSVTSARMHGRTKKYWRCAPGSESAALIRIKGAPHELGTTSARKSDDGAAVRQRGRVASNRCFGDGDSPASHR